MLFLPPPPPPVSYTQQVAPILALHCNGCHGDAGGLSTRTYADLMAGGHLGRLIMPGHPDRSILLHFVDGRRGEEQRMPLGGRPLSREQIDTLRRWIAEGAKQDSAPSQVHRLHLPNTALDPQNVLRIFCRVNTQAYLTVTARDPQSRRRLWTEVASLKSPKERGDAGAPGELISWDVRAGDGWPKSVDIELIIEYAAGLRNTEFYAHLVEK